MNRYALGPPPHTHSDSLIFRVLLLFLALGTGTPSLRAQQAQPNTYSGFNGQTISRVEIAARPGVDIGEMQRLIALQAKHLFSAQALLQSVAALQQTHLFTEVQVSFTPDQNGLGIVFILQPADYVGIVTFRGTGTKFPYTALLQAADIPEQSPFVPDSKTQGQEGLIRYFHSQGYFEAQVTPEVQRDEPHHIVNVIFQCVLSGRAKIGSVEFAGLPDRESDALKKELRGWWARLRRFSLMPGQRYSQDRADESIPFISNHLRKDNQLAPSVRLSTSNYDPASSRVNVVFGVTPGPPISVTLEGAKASGKTIRRLVPIYEENSVDQDLIDEGEANLKAYFQKKGYFDVAANSHRSTNNGVVNVVYEMDLGSRHRVKGIYFDGDHYYSDGQLKSHLSISKGFLFLRRGSFSQQLLSKSVVSITQLYKDQGFTNVSVQPKVEDFEPEVDVTFEITEGPQDKVETLQVVGNKTQSTATLEKKSAMQLRPGSIFSQKRLDADRNQLLAAYLDLGYLNANVRSAAAPSQNDPHKIVVTYTVTEGPQAHIADIVSLGEAHTKPSFVQEVTRAQIKPEQPLSEERLLQAESDLYNLGTFDWASIKPLRPIVDQTQEEVLVKIHESPLNTMDVGGGIEIIPRDANIPVNAVAVPGLPPLSLGNKFTISQKSYFGPRFTFDFTRHDIRGRAETATFGTILSRLDQRGFFTYADPKLHGSSWSSLLNVSGERTTENPIYTAELAQASFQIEKSLNAKRTKQLIARYTFERTNLYNILIPGLVLPQDQHVHLSTIEGEYIRDTRDQPLDAHHGLYQTADFGITPTAFGSTANFLRFLGQNAFYLQVKPWLVWANNFRLGLAAPFSNSQVPLSERFFSGGADSLRGFPINGAGPQRPLPVCSNPADESTCTLISVPVGGNMLFIFNSEARFPLPFKQGLGGVFFYDGGNVYSNISLNQFVNDFTHSVGVGVRYRTPVGPVRFDLGYRITQVPGVKATQYFVTLGQSF